MAGKERIIPIKIDNHRLGRHHRAAGLFREIKEIVKDEGRQVLQSKFSFYPEQEGKQESPKAEHKGQKPSVRPLYKDQDYETLVRKQRNGLFEDRHFDTSGSLLTRRFQHSGDVKWLRPGQIAREKEPEFVADGRSRFDVKQGEVGNCWFLSALANLAENRKCFYRVVPDAKKQVFRDDYKGIFRFHFFRFNEWVEVVVDDRLPTRNGRLIYLRSTDHNEFWGPLLEKAYAKFYGSYQSLDGGLAVEAGVDFTGGIPEMISLSAHEENEKRRLFGVLQRAMGRKSSEHGFLSSSLRGGGGMGLAARHAYSITAFLELTTREGERVRLVRVRNPHGNDEEWRGSWSDKDDRNWNKISDKERYNKKKDDGEFYMAFDDFLVMFGEVEVVHVKPSSMEGAELSDKWEVFAFNSKWERETAGGCGNDSIDSFLANPMFIFDVEDPDTRDRREECSMIVSLAQKPKDRKNATPIGFRVYQIEGSSKKDVEASVKYKDPVGKTERYVNTREVSIQLSMKPGKYVVIASTFHRGSEGAFLLRVFLTRGWGSSDQATRHTARSGMAYRTSRD